MRCIASYVGSATWRETPSNVILFESSAFHNISAAGGRVSYALTLLLLLLQTACTATTTTVTVLSVPLFWPPNVAKRYLLLVQISTPLFMTRLDQCIILRNTRVPIKRGPPLGTSSYVFHFRRNFFFFFLSIAFNAGNALVFYGPARFRNDDLFRIARFCVTRVFNVNVSGLKNVWKKKKKIFKIPWFWPESITIKFAFHAIAFGDRKTRLWNSPAPRW